MEEWQVYLTAQAYREYLRYCNWIREETNGSTRAIWLEYAFSWLSIYHRRIAGDFS